MIYSEFTNYFVYVLLSITRKWFCRKGVRQCISFSIDISTIVVLIVSTTVDSMYYIVYNAITIVNKGAEWPSYEVLAVILKFCSIFLLFEGFLLKGDVLMDGQVPLENGGEHLTKNIS